MNYNKEPNLLEKELVNVAQYSEESITLELLTFDMDEGDCVNLLLTFMKETLILNGLQTFVKINEKNKLNINYKFFIPEKVTKKSCVVYGHVLVENDGKKVKKTLSVPIFNVLPSINAEEVLL